MNRSQKIYFSLFVCIAVLLAVIGSRAQVVRSVGTTNELVNLPNPNSISSNTLVTSSAEFWSWVVGDATTPNGSNVLQSATDPTGGRFKLLPISSIITSIGGFRVTNLFVTIVTNVDSLYVTNLYATNITVNLLTNVGNFYVTNTYTSNLYVTNIYFQTTVITNINQLLTTFANPTASVGLTAQNGSSTNAMRADAAPALDVSISPTWTGEHTYTKNVGAQLAVGATDAVDFTYADRTNDVSGAMTFLYATNGVDLVSRTCVRWFFNGSGSDQTLTIPSGWRTNAFSPVPSKLTNGWITAMYCKFLGPTSSAALQTNVTVSFEYYH